MSIYFETERLIVRQYTLDDINDLFQIMSDMRIHTFTKDKNNPWDELRAEKYINFMINKDFQTLDCFHGAVIEKQNNQLIGLCGLNPYLEKEPEIEFKLGVLYWGRGYATELGKQIIKEAFATTDIKGIYGMAQPENTASRKVLERIGMRYLGNRIFRNHEVHFTILPTPQIVIKIALRISMYISARPKNLFNGKRPHGRATGNTSATGRNVPPVRCGDSASSSPPFRT